MPNNVNSATRLLNILMRAKASGADHVFQAWSVAFDLTASEEYINAIRIVQRLVWLQAEVAAVREGMAGKSFSTVLYEPALAYVQNALHPYQLRQPWKAVADNYLSAEVMTSLGFCSEILPDEESIILDVDRDEIRRLMVELEMAIQETTIPIRLKTIIQHHIDLIHEALEKYAVMGAVALRDAAWMAAGELLSAEADPTLENEDFSDRAEVTKLKTLWSKVNSVVDSTIKVQSLYELGSTITSLLKG